MERPSYTEIMNRNVGSVLTTLIAAFIIGTVAMIYSSDKANQVFAVKLENIVVQMTSLNDKIEMLESQMREGIRDRWTKSDHKDYDRRIQKKLDALDKRINILERGE